MVEEEYVSVNYPKQIKVLKEEQKVIDTFSDKQVKELIRYYNKSDYLSVRNKLIVMLFVDTGIRCTELRQIKTDFVFDNYIKLHGKGNKWRVVPISSSLQKQFLKYERMKNAYFTSRQIAIKDDTLLLTRSGENIKSNVAIEKIIGDASIGIEGGSDIRYQLEGYMKEVIMPSGVDLVNSKEMLGAYRGFFKGADGLSGHANLVPVELGSKLGNVMGTVSSVMNVASIMVGQYYMSEINSRLQSIENDIKNISNFQKNEFESKIITKIFDVMELSKFSDEIMKSEELRQHKLIRIDTLKSEIGQMIEQLIRQIKQELVNLNKKKILEYEEKSRDLDKQIKLLINLMMSLHELGNIELIFGKDVRIREMAFDRYNLEEKRVLSLFESVKSWHLDQGIAYKIDFKNSRRPKQGIRKTVSTVQARHDETKKYDYLEANFSQLLNEHLELTLKKPVQITEPEKFRIIYNSENEKSYIALG